MTMNGKRQTTEEKICALREADGGKPIWEVYQERNISEARCHRWRKQFALIQVDDARRLKAMEREISELKKMLIASLRSLVGMVEWGGGRVKTSGGSLITGSLAVH